MRKLEISIDVILKITGYLAAALLVVTIFIISGAMLSRNFVGATLPWAQELATWTAAGGVLLGGGYTFNQGAFVRVDVIYSNFSPGVQRAMDAVLGTICVLLIGAVLLWFGTRFFLMSWRIDEVSSTGAWRGRVWVVKGLLPIGTILLLMAWVSHLIKLYSPHQP